MTCREELPRQKKEDAPKNRSKQNNNTTTAFNIALFSVNELNRSNIYTRSWTIEKPRHTTRTSVIVKTLTSSSRNAFWVSLIKIIMSPRILVSHSRVSYLATEHEFYITSCHLKISFYHAKRKQKKRKQTTKVSTPNTSSPLPVQS